MAYWRGTTEPLEHEQEWVSQVGMRERHDTLQGSVSTDNTIKVFVEQSSDGQHWDLSEEISVEKGTPKGINVALLLPYWRVRASNEATEESGDIKELRIWVNTQAGGDS